MEPPDFDKLLQQTSQPLNFGQILGQLKSTQDKLANFRIRGLGVSGNMQHGHGYRVRPGDDCEQPVEGTSGTPVFTPMGACCDDLGNCVIATEASCTSSGGTYQGDGTVCDPNPCPQPTGACCATDGSCTIATQADCEGGGGTWQGMDTVCDPNPCPVMGACCHGTSCSIETQSDCEGTGGVYEGDGVPCTMDLCAGEGYQNCCTHFGQGFNPPCQAILASDSCASHGWEVNPAGNAGSCSWCISACCSDTHVGGFHQQCCTELPAIDCGPDIGCSPDPYTCLGANTNCIDDCWTATGDCFFSGPCWVCAE